MSKLRDLIQELCPNGVEYKKLGDVCRIEKGIQFNKSNMSDVGTFPVINGGMRPSGYIEQYNQAENTITISQGGASAGYVNFIETKFWAGAHCYILRPSDEVLNRYVYHFLKQNENKLQECQYGAGIPALAKAKIEQLQIPLPPLAVQSEIVRVLDSFTLLTAELTAELTARQQQYEYYRNKLLSFDKSSRGGCKWLKLSEMAIVTKLAGFEFTKYVKYSLTGSIIALRGLNVKSGHLNLDDVKYIDDSNFSKLRRSKLYKDDMLFTYVGTVGQVALIDKDDKYYLAPNVALIRFTGKSIYPPFMKYYFQTATFQKTQVDKYSGSSSMKNLTMENIRKFQIPIPPLSEQERIVSILDKFEALVNDLSEGLPAEIAAVQQQYEYYRDRLLTFPRFKQSA